LRSALGHILSAGGKRIRPTLGLLVGNMLGAPEEKLITLGASVEFTIAEQYRNMKQVLNENPQVAAYAAEAINRAGLDVKTESIRGGTDGSKLSYMGLPCPNIFAGEHAFHSKHEWVSVQDMQKAVETILHLCMIWEEKA